MALQLGTEKKWQVYLVAGVLAVTIPALGWEVYGMFATPSTPVPTVTPAPSPALQTESAATRIPASSPRIPLRFTWKLLSRAPGTASQP